MTAGTITAITDVAVNIFNDVSALWVLAIGLPMGFWIARKVIGLVRVR